MIECKSPSLFKGYWKLPEKTKSEFTEDGFFITGDMGEFDDQGKILMRRTFRYLIPRTDQKSLFYRI